MIKINNRNFWLAQSIGWGTFALMNLVLQFVVYSQNESSSFGIKQALINSLIAFIAGFGITTGYRFLLKSLRINLLKFSTTFFYIIASTIVLSLCFILVVFLIVWVFGDNRQLTIVEAVGNGFTFSILMLMWNSLYFMIHYLHNWNKSESEKWQLVAAVKEAQLGSLKAQINPHFMFNAINNIKALISEDPERAKDMLMNFSDMFRYSLIHNDKSLVSVEDELEIVNKYLELLTVQFEDKLSYEINADPLLLKKKIPPMMVQLLAENAVKHGISELPEGGKVVVNIMDQGEILVLQVSNSGSLKNSANIQRKLGVGLQNIRERLALIYDERTNLSLDDRNGLVVAEIRIPLTLQNTN